MHKDARARICLLVTALLVVAGPQAQVSAQSDGDVVQSGFAVVTASSPNSFGIATSVRLVQPGGGAAILGSTALTTGAGLVIDIDRAVGRESALVILNPQNFLVTVELFLREGGRIIASRSLQLGAQDRLSSFISEVFGIDRVPARMTGLLVVRSSVPISVAGLRLGIGTLEAIPLIELSGSPFLVSLTGGTGAQPVFPQPQIPTAGLAGGATFLQPQTPTTGITGGATFVQPQIPNVGLAGGATFLQPQTPTTGITGGATFLQPQIPAPGTTGVPSIQQRLPAPGFGLGTDPTGRVATQFIPDPRLRFVPDPRITGPLTTTDLGVIPDPRITGPLTTNDIATGTQTQIVSSVDQANVFLVPQVAFGAGWFSEILITNVGPTAQSVRIDFFDSEGTSLNVVLEGSRASSFTGLTVPAQDVRVIRIQ